MIIAGSFLLALTVATAQPTTTYSRWVSLTPDPRQFATQPGGVLPLAVVGDASFAAGRYMIYVATSNPDGKTISRWSSFGPFNLQGGEKWQAILQPGAKLRMEKNPGALLTYSSPGSGQAMIYARNEDRSSWQSVCVLPVGGNVRTDCFGGTSNVVFGGAGSATLSKWTSITPDQRQFAAQPGGMLPLAVLGGPNFVAGAYMIYVESANPDGRAVGKWNAFGPFTLEGDDKWAAHLLPQSQLRMEKNPAGLLPYSNPGAMRAMIYARNDDTSSWEAICVLPVGMTVTPSCFGGSGNIVIDVKGLAGGIDGAYSGSIAVTQSTPEKAIGTGTLTLTITGGTVSGTMSVRTGDIEKKAVITGTVSADGRITATAKGASKYLKPEPQDKPGQWVNTEKMGWLLISGLATFDFHGTFEGKITQGRASGSFTANRSDKPPSDRTRIAGTWQTSHQ